MRRAGWIAAVIVTSVSCSEPGATRPAVSPGAVARERDPAVVAQVRVEGSWQVDEFWGEAAELGADGAFQHRDETTAGGSDETIRTCRGRLPAERASALLAPFSAALPGLVVIRPDDESLPAATLLLRDGAQRGRFFVYVRAEDAERGAPDETAASELAAHASALLDAVREGARAPEAQCTSETRE